MDPRILWISTVHADRHSGGAGAYARGILELIRHVFPDAALTRVEPGPEGNAHRTRQVLSVGRSFIGRRSAKWHFDAPSRLEGKVREAAAATPDLAFIYGTAAGSLVPLLPRSMPRILVATGVDSAVYDKQLERSALPVRLLMRRVLRDAERHRQLERESLEGIDGCIAISRETAAGLSALAGRALRAEVIPPLFEAPGRATGPRSGGPGRVGFVGRMSWWPNREAIAWFLRDVWIPLKNRDLEFHVFGEGSEKFHKPTAGVFGHGHVPDAACLWSGIDLFVNPMLSSTGVNVKVCEAIHQGVPVLTTREGLRGLDLPGDPAVAIHDGAAAWTHELQPGRFAQLARCEPAAPLRQSFEFPQYAASFRRFVEQTLSSPSCRADASSA